MIELLLAAENALALGLVDQAEKTFRQVLEADPRNGIAAVGLSRVALERGDEAGALALARAALEIDPENATARRTILRLEEVARYRAAAAATAAATSIAPAEPSVAPAIELAPAGQPGLAAEPSDHPARPVERRPAAGQMPQPGEPIRAAEQLRPADAPMTQPGPLPAIPMPAPRSATPSTPAPSRPAPTRPGLLRRLLRRS